MKKRNIKPLTVLLAFTLLFSFIPKWFQPKVSHECIVSYNGGDNPDPHIEEFDD